jgi:hypothetical protein
MHVYNYAIKGVAEYILTEDEINVLWKQRLVNSLIPDVSCPCGIVE